MKLIVWLESAEMSPVIWIHVIVDERELDWKHITLTATRLYVIFMILKLAEAVLFHLQFM